MPKVLRIITRLNRGGPLRQLCALVPGLAALGWSGPVLAGVREPTEPDGAEDLRATGAEVIDVPELTRGIDPVMDARALRAIVKHIRRAEPDLIHTHMGKAGAVGRAAGRLAGVPVVHTLHGHHFDRPGLLGKGIRAAERVLGRLGHALICLSASQREDVVERHGIVAPDRVHVIEPGFDVEAFQARAAGTVRRPSDVLQLVWTGRFVEAKAPLALLDVVEAMQGPVHLTAFGDGPLRPAFEAAVRTRGLSTAVASPGPVDDVAPVVAAADVLVLTSVSEGVPLSVLEAMVVGTPVVVTAVGGLPDVIADGVTGRLVPAGDAQALARVLDELAAAPAARGALARAALGRAATRFGMVRLAQETAALYATLCPPQDAHGRDAGR